MNGIDLTNVTYHHKKRNMFTNINMKISRYSITCLIGPNGSGKSTFLKLLGGLITPLDGKVNLDGINVDLYSRKAFAKKLAYLPQRCRIPSSLTVREYVALARFSYQSWFSGLKMDDYAAVEDAITLVDMNTFADKVVTTLSAGQQQRARIALMLAQQAQYLLLDEPMTGLDLKQQRKMLELLVCLQNKHAKTIIVILHDLQQVMEIASEVILLKDGCVLGQGHPHEVINTDCVLKVFDYECDISSMQNKNMFYILPKPITVREANV